MSVQIDHEKVAKRLALKIADLEYQVTAYKTVAEDMQEKIQQLENTLKTFEGSRQDDGSDDPVPAV